MCVLFRCLVIYNDYDNYFERFGQIRETNELFKKIQVFIDSKNHKRNEKIKPLDKEEIVKMLDTYVALGSNVMNGAAAYVSIIYEDHIVVTDPVRGNFFDPSSTSCTLLNIGVVFNDENIWLNIQPNVAPLLTAWDLYNPKCWKPFFEEKEFPYIPHSVTEADVEYDEIQPEFAVDLERDVEELIKQCIQEDRSEQLTT